MPPFAAPVPVITGFKERIEALEVQGDKLYLGTSIGNLHVYRIDEALNAEGQAAVLVETKKSLTRKAIEQLGYIKDITSLTVLSESLLTLFPLPTFTPPTPLLKTKGAFSFSVHTSVQHLLPGGKAVQSSDGTFAKANSIPTQVTQLVVGCRRKVVVYSWKDGEAQEAQELPLPHSPRAVAFLNQDTVCFAYSATEFAIFSISKFTVTDIISPLPATTSAPGIGGIGALSGLTGYISLGLGAKSKPSVVQISDSEVLIAKESEGIVIGPDAKPSRTSTIQWPATPEEIAYIKPYIFSVLPPGSVPNQQMDSPSPTGAPAASVPTTVVQIRSLISSLPTQTLAFPFSNTTTATNTLIRLLTASPSAKSPLYLVTTSADKAAATIEGTSVWQISIRPWVEQIDELVQAGQYSEALSLLDTIDVAVFPDKDQRRVGIRALNAVSQFRSGFFDQAIDTFIELDLNPAKIVALYPDSIAGRLAIPKDRWIPLYGGPEHVEDTVTPSNASTKEESRERTAADIFDNPAPIHPKSKIVQDSFHRSVETLIRYLSDRRPKLAGALEAVKIKPDQSHKLASLSETSTEDLFTLPNAPLLSLTPGQLLRYAQIVDTALYKSYLVVRPALLGPLCRVPNWCEVSEVEEELRAREKFAELIYLYNGKKMHGKALNLLKQLSDKETDVADKLGPSISYLQKLGPEHLDQIFESSRWMFDLDSETALEIFKSEDVELPRQLVADYLESIDPRICARYLEYLIEEHNEESPIFHDRLAELYLNMTLTARKRGDDKSRKEFYAKLLQFLDSTHHFRLDRLYGILSSEDLFEARAILLGQLGRHDQALELYVYKLQDYMKAEAYCKRVYAPGTPTSNVFLTLLRIYLRPTIKTSSDLLQPALELIGRHSPRLDTVETLQLLPPLVTTEDVRTFLIEALRAPIFDSRVIRGINKAHSDQLSRKLMLLESKRVKVTDSRICPQCHKRLGNSIIAVHAPRGEVTHYKCREAFSRRLQESSH